MAWHMLVKGSAAVVHPLEWACVKIHKLIGKSSGRIFEGAMYPCYLS